MRSGFFDNTIIYADDFAKFAGGMITNGVLADTETALLVTAPESGMSVDVGAGYAWINGHFGCNEETASVVISPADGSLGRIDRIVARLDYNTHTLSLQAITGTLASTPEPPDIVRNSNIYDLGLATVSVPAGTLNITSAMIIDTRRDASICGAAFPRLPDAFIYPGANNIGDIKMTACVAAPDMWMICDGSAISRTTYIDLFSAIGTTYGAGDGSTTFNIPDLRGRTAFGKNSGTFSPLGKTGGEEKHTMTIAEMPAHSHSSDLSISSIRTFENSGSAKAGKSVDAERGQYDSSYPISSTITIGNAGSGTPFNVTPPYITLNYIIYTGVSEI